MSSMATAMSRSAIDAKESIYETSGQGQHMVCTAIRLVRRGKIVVSLDYTHFLVGRRCDDPACRGDLEDTIINFGECLPQGVFT